MRTQLKLRTSVYLFGLLTFATGSNVIAAQRFDLPKQIQVSSANSEADSEAARALVTLKKLITTKNYQTFGLKSFDEVSQLEIENGTVVFVVDNNDLKDFKIGNGISSVLKLSNMLIYPVTVNGDGRIIITMRKINGRWQIASFGQQDVAHNLASYTQGRKFVDSFGNKRAPATFAIQIPAMHLSFVASSVTDKPGSPSKVFLTPLNSASVIHQSPEVKGNKYLMEHFAVMFQGKLTSDEIFGSLATTAKELNDRTVPN